MTSEHPSVGAAGESGASSPEARGGPKSHTYCAEVIAEVWSLLDGECTPQVQQQLRQHLDECPECLRQYGIEQRIKSLIARSCGGDKAPPTLYQRVRWEIRRTTIIRRPGRPG